MTSSPGLHLSTKSSSRDTHIERGIAPKPTLPICSFDEI